MPRRSRATRRRFGAALAAAAAGAGGACRRARPVPGGRRRAVVLGLDGLDPRIVQALMDAGRAPHFRRLGTTMPALSPVAWSTFITGTDPGSHTVADFIVRDPATYQPRFSIWEPRPPARTLALGAR